LKVKTFLVVLFFFLLAFSGQAATISFGSGDGLNESNNMSAANVVVTPHPLWGMPAAPYQWISYVDSGVGGVVLPNTTVPTDGTYGSPTAVFRENLPFGTYLVTISVRADDTAGVWLYDADNPNGLLLKAPNPVQDGACAAGSIGCEVAESWTSTFAVNYGTGAWLAIPTYQVGSGPFALSYDGTASAIPEPGTYLMLAGGLGALAFLRRRKT
jgi:hypothetical protein